LNLELAIAAFKMIFDEYDGVVHNVFLGHSDASKSEASSPQRSERMNIHSAVAGQLEQICKQLETGACQLGRIDCVDRVRNWQQGLFGEITDILTHALTNAIDHGYVLPSRRGELVADAELSIAATREKDLVTIEVSDNGSGFDMQRIEAMAKAQGYLPPAGESMLNILFVDGVSTAEKVSQTSGRGVGLAAIKAMTEDLGGRVTLARNEPCGARLIIHLPAAIVAS
jgi:signal transduction histidine kinase